MKFWFALITVAVAFVAPGHAQPKAVSVTIKADGDFDTCGLGQTTAAAAGHAGPDASYNKTDTLKSGTRVWMFEEKGEWIGVAYGADEIECSPIKKDKAYDGPGKSGWVGKKYIKLLAG